MAVAMALETVPGHDATYHLVSYDARGRERQEVDGRYSDAVLSAATTSDPTDVFVFSHGWNGDVPAARRQYGTWVATMLECAADRDLLATAPGGFRPMLVGLHWPSKAWGDEEFGQASFGIAETAGPALDVDAVIDLFTSRLANTSSTRDAVRTIVKAALRDAAPRSLPGPVRQAYHVIDADAGIGATGEGTAPGDDREPFDPERMYQGCLRAEAVSFGELSLGGILAPLRVLTFWQMKGRARTFGGDRRGRPAWQPAAGMSGHTVPLDGAQLRLHRRGGSAGRTTWLTETSTRQHADARAGRHVAVVVLLEHSEHGGPAGLLPANRGRLTRHRTDSDHDISARSSGGHVLPARGMVRPSS